MLLALSNNDTSVPRKDSKSVDALPAAVTAADGD